MGRGWTLVLGAALIAACGKGADDDDAIDAATGGTSSVGGGGGNGAVADGGDAGQVTATGGVATDGGGSSVGGSGGRGPAGDGGAGGGAVATGGASTSGGAGGNPGDGISADYPGDVGIDADPSVVFYDGFEAAAVTDIVARYEDAKDAGLAISSDVAPGTSGSQSLEMVASGTGTNATDLYKLLEPGYDELFVRYYVKYQAGPEWHHSGMWIGGYSPPTSWPNPRAGTRPAGDDRVSVAIEPIENAVSNPRLDTYNYWMTMHSWMEVPSGDTAYYGNPVVHDASFRVDDDEWMCIELHVKLNTELDSGAGAELGIWKNDESIIQYTDRAPVGYWVRDKFCPESADSPSCTDYPPSAGTTLVPLDFQSRTTTDLELNHVWPQNYITSGGAGSVWYDHLVVATARIGCMQ
jgi:hypothetical protein